MALKSNYSSNTTNSTCIVAHMHTICYLRRINQNPEADLPKEEIPSSAALFPHNRLSCPADIPSIGNSTKSDQAAGRTLTLLGSIRVSESGCRISVHVYPMVYLRAAGLSMQSHGYGTDSLSWCQVSNKCRIPQAKPVAGC